MNRIMLLEENKELKKQLEIKHNGFMASVEEACELAKENQELNERINYYQNILNLNLVKDFV